MYKVVFDDKIKKDLKKLDKQTLKALFNWIEKNLHNTTEPRIKGKALIGNKKGYWRYRIGDYRLVVDIQDKDIIILILDIGHRKGIY